jgi:L-arabinose isomerase
VARVLWDPKPNLKIAAAAWILAGGAHHTSFTQALSLPHIIDLAGMLGIECLIIDENTDIQNFMKDIKMNEVYYYLANGIR